MHVVEDVRIEISLEVARPESAMGVRPTPSCLFCGRRVLSPIASNTFETRRFRVAADIRIRDWIRGYFEPEYALARLSLRQAWVGLQLDSGTLIRGNIQIH